MIGEPSLAGQALAGQALQTAGGQALQTAGGQALGGEAIAGLVIGGAVVVLATAAATRARSFGAAVLWVGLAGLGQAMLGLAAASQDPAGDGARAAALQVVAVVLAVAVAWLSAGQAGGEQQTTGGVGVPLAGRWVAWASLIGVPATVGFHARAALAYSLLALNWTGFTVLVLAAGAVTMWPALAALRIPQVGQVARWRSALAVAGAMGLVGLGVYPQWGIAVAERLARAVLSG